MAVLALQLSCLNEDARYLADLTLMGQSLLRSWVGTARGMTITGACAPTPLPRSSPAREHSANHPISNERDALSRECHRQCHFPLESMNETLRQLVTANELPFHRLHC